jgi:hypothetical protein
LLKPQRDGGHPDTLRIKGLGVKVWGVERAKYQIPKPKFQGLYSDVIREERIYYIIASLVVLRELSALVV